MQIQLPKIVCILTMETKISTAWGLEKSKGCEYFLEQLSESCYKYSFQRFLHPSLSKAF